MKSETREAITIVQAFLDNMVVLILVDWNWWAKCGALPTCVRYPNEEQAKDCATW